MLPPLAYWSEVFSRAAVFSSDTKATCDVSLPAAAGPERRARLEGTAIPGNDAPSGCRLAITYPEILVMQVRAITEATIRRKKAGGSPKPEIMIPLVGVSKELETLRALAVETIAEVKKAKGYRGRLDIPIGTMIEVPRAALRAGAIAEHADFFSFGTNDLTQLTFGYSRDDVNGFLPEYLSQEILPRDPFESLDQIGVGPLLETAVQQGRETNPGMKIGICGEHGGDPESVFFCDRAGLDYVSCSPFRVPIARLAAAQSAAL